VTTLLEQLSQSNPDITAEEAAEFRACVLTIAQHNETDPKCIGFSLQDWEQWLENGGYGLNNFVAMLKQVCNAALGDAAVATLWDYAQSIATAPEGIPRLIEYVQTTYPGLEQRMTTLEALALEEEQRIQETAGGMSKKAGIVTGVVNGAVAGVVAGVIIKYGYNRYKLKAQREAAQLKERADREAEEAYNNKTEDLKSMINERSISDFRSKVDRADYMTMRSNFAVRAKVFNFQAYAKDRLDKLSLDEFHKFKEMQADHLNQKPRNFRTDIESDLLKGKYTDRGDVSPGWAFEHGVRQKILENPGFEKYVMDRYVLTNAERLIKMNDRDFASFLEGEGKGFVRGEGSSLGQFIGDGKIDLERKIEDYVKNEVVSLEKSVMDDVEIDIDKSVVQATKELEVKVETKAEEAVVRETDRIEAAVEGWEAAVDDII
jgi:hypothetical protein